MLGYTYGLAGYASDARKMLGRLRKMSRQRYIEPASLAIIYTGLGDKELAFEWLERAYEHRNELLMMLRVDPRLDALRSDIRFTHLLRRIGLA